MYQTPANWTAWVGSVDTDPQTEMLWAIRKNAPMPQMMFVLRIWSKYPRLTSGIISASSIATSAPWDQTAHVQIQPVTVTPTVQMAWRPASASTAKWSRKSVFADRIGSGAARAQSLLRQGSRISLHTTRKTDKQFMNTFERIRARSTRAVLGTLREGYGHAMRARQFTGERSSAVPLL